MSIRHGSCSGMGLRNWRLGHASYSLARARCLAVVLVGGKVERDEEDEVRADNPDAGECSELLSGTLTRAGQRRKVGRGEVGIGCEIDEAWVL